MAVFKAYKFRIYPTPEQRQFFIETFGCVRFTYNQLLLHQQDSNEDEKLTPARLKQAYPFLKKVDSLALANAQRNLERAFQNFYQGRASFPKFKRKNSLWQAYTTNNQGRTIYLEEDQLKLPKLKTLVKVEVHRSLQGEIRSATISARNNQAFYVSLLCREEVAPLPKTAKSIRLTFCPRKLIVEPTELLPTIEFEPIAARGERLARRLLLRKQVARKRRVPLSQAKNYQKQKQKLDKLLLRQKQLKTAYIDELSIALIRQYDQIYLAPEVAVAEACDEGHFSAAD